MTETSSADASRKKSWLSVIGPGILVAATGVGAGDLATGAFTGDKLGTVILWAVIVGAFFKYILNEGLTRWQLVTGDTLLEGCMRHFGSLFRWSFVIYLVVWSFLVALALMSACGATMHAMLPWLDAADAKDPVNDKIAYGIFHSLLAILLVKLGGFQFFERCMSLCIGLMFVTVIATVAALQPDVPQIVSGLLVPRIPGLIEGESLDGLTWTVALLGGVGGTLTIVCYGYWIKELGRTGTGELRECRLDLASGYVMTALFGIAMVIIGEHSGPFSKTGSALLVELSQTLSRSIGPVASWVFLVGAWGAVFSSLLGVWQSVPYLFADFWNLTQHYSRGNSSEIRPPVDTKSWAYQAYLYAIGTLPAIGLFLLPFKQTQKVYAVVGAFSIPFIALILLLLCGSSRYLGEEHRNRPATNLLLWLILLFFAAATGITIWQKLG